MRWSATSPSWRSSAATSGLRCGRMPRPTNRSRSPSGRLRPVPSVSAAPRSARPRSWWPQVTPSKIARVAALNLAAADGFSVVADHLQNVADLAAAARTSGKVLDVVVDFSAGHHRTGAATAEDAIVLAQAVDDAAGLRL